MSSTPNVPRPVEEIRRYFIVNPINRHYSSKVRHQMLPNVQNYRSTNISPHRRYGNIRHDSIHSYTSLLRLSLNYNRHRRFTYWYTIEVRRNSAKNRRLIGYQHVLLLPYPAPWVGRSPIYSQVKTSMLLLYHWRSLPNTKKWCNPRWWLTRTIVIDASPIDIPSADSWHEYQCAKDKQ